MRRKLVFIMSCPHMVLIAATILSFTGLTESFASTTHSRATVSWVSAVSGNWSDGTKWSTGSPPAAGDDVAVIVAGTYTVTLDTDAQINSLSFGGASGTQTLTMGAPRVLNITQNANFYGNSEVNFTGGTLHSGSSGTVLQGQFDFSGGTLTGSGGFRLTGVQAAMDLLTSTAKTLDGTTLEIEANMTIDGSGQINLVNGAMLTSSIMGNVIIRTPMTFADNGGGDNRFRNYGTLLLRGMAASSIVYMQVPFDLRNGDIDLETGILDLRGGGESWGGTYALDSGTTCRYTVGTHNFLGTYDSLGDLAGALQFAGATVDMHSSGATFNCTGTGMAWLSGTISGSGTLETQGQFTISGANTKTLSQATLKNSGQLDMGGTGGCSFSSGATLENTVAGQIDLQNDLNIVADASDVRISNAGTFTKSAGSAITYVYVGFDNSGTVNVQQGTLQLRGGGSLSGEFNTSNGALLDLVLGSFTLEEGSSFTGAGTCANTSGTMTLNGTSSGTQVASTTTFELRGGTIQGSGHFDCDGRFDWQGGTITGSGQFTVGSPLIFSGSSVKTLNGQTLVNETSALITGGGSIRFWNDASFLNQASATTEFQVAVSVETDGSNTLFVNQGELSCTHTGTVYFYVPLDQQNGQIDVSSGTLQLRGNSQYQDGTYDVESSGRLEFLTGTHQLSGTLSGTIDGELWLSGASLNVQASGCIFDFANQGLSWRAGTMTGTGTLENQGILTLDTVSTKTLNAITIDNQNRLVFAGTGPFAMQANALVSNQSQMEIQADFTATKDGTQPALINAGILTKTGGASVSYLNPAMNNQGTLQVQSGTLRLQGGGQHSGTYVVDAGTEIQCTTGTFTWQDGARLQGDGRCLINGGTVSAADLATATVDPGATLTLSGGFVGGNGNYQIHGTFDWQGGTIQGSGDFVVGSPLLITTTGSKTLNERTVTLDGTATITGTGTLNLNNNASFLVNPGAQLEIQAGLSISDDTSDCRLENHGNIHVDTPASVYLETELHNLDGHVNVLQGTLQIRDHSMLDNLTVDVEAGAVVDFILGAHHIQGTLSGDVRGTFRFTGATWDVDATGAVIHLTGQGMTWQAGTLAGDGSLANTGVVSFESANSKTLDHITFENHNHLEINGSGPFQFSNGSKFINAATGNLDINSDLTLQLSGMSDSSFTNDGTLIKHGSSLTHIYPDFVNQGTLVTLDGELRFETPFVQINGETVMDGGSLRFMAGGEVFDGVLRGEGTVTGNLWNEGTIEPGLSPGSIQLIGTFQQALFGELDLEFSGLTPGADFDQVNISGAASLGGGIRTRLIDPYRPDPGDRFQVMTFASSSGSFAATTDFDLGDGLEFVLDPYSDHLDLVVQCYLYVAADAPVICDISDTIALEARRLCWTEPYVFTWGVSGPAGAWIDPPDGQFATFHVTDWGVYQIDLEVLDGESTLREATRRVVVFNPDVDAIPGITSDDWGFCLFHWRDSADAFPAVDADESGTLDILDLITVMACYQDP